MKLFLMVLIICFATIFSGCGKIVPAEDFDTATHTFQTEYTAAIKEGTPVWPAENKQQAAAVKKYETAIACLTKNLPKKDKTLYENKALDILKSEQNKTAKNAAD
jgi:hypothetical protein